MEISKVNTRNARISGVLFLLMILFGLAAEVLFRQKLFVVDDNAATANNILSNITICRLGITSDIFMTLFYLFTALALFRLLSQVNKELVKLMIVFAALGCVVLLINILNELAPLYILNGSELEKSFDLEQRQSIAMFSYNMYQQGYMLGQVFFSLWVFPLGLLIYRSNFIPKVFGVLFMIETIAGLIGVVVHFSMPNSMIETVMMLPMTVAEFSFVFYLIIKGIRKIEL